MPKRTYTRARVQHRCTPGSKDGLADTRSDRQRQEIYEVMEEVAFPDLHACQRGFMASPSVEVTPWLLDSCVLIVMLVKHWMLQIYFVAVSDCVEPPVLCTLAVRRSPFGLDYEGFPLCFEALLRDVREQSGHRNTATLKQLRCSSASTAGVLPVPVLAITAVVLALSTVVLAVSTGSTYWTRGQPRKQNIYLMVTERNARDWVRIPARSLNIPLPVCHRPSIAGYICISCNVEYPSI